MRTWKEILLFGIGLGIIIETLILLSPLFETSLWGTFSNFVKVIPIMVLHFTGVIGLILVAIAVFSWKYGKRRR